MGQIIVGIDGSDGAAAALRWAHREADLRGWTVTAVLAWNYLDQPGDAQERDFDPAYTEDDARALLDRVVGRALGPEPSPPVDTQVVTDLAASALIRASGDADLLVVGARGLGGFKALLLGSVSEQCLHHARCPVAVVHDGADTSGVEGGTPAERPRIVVGVDGSEGAQRALRWALDEARARQASLTGVHTWRTPVAGFGPVPIPIAPEELEAEARQTLEGALAAADTSGLVEPVEQVALPGVAAQGLLHTAKGADLIVVGTRGRGGFTGLLLGSVSQQVARHADCPVVVVPAAAPR